MARSTKTQQDSTQKSPGNGSETPSPAQIAQHFMQIWQDQWQSALQQQPIQAGDLQKNWAQAMQNTNIGNMTPTGFGFPAGFGQNPNHAATPTTTPDTPDALALATAALAASEQCLELLKQCSQWMDGINQRITALEHYTATPAKRPAAAPHPITKKPTAKPKRTT